MNKAPIMIGPVTKKNLAIDPRYVLAQKLRESADNIKITDIPSGLNSVLSKVLAQEQQGRLMREYSNRDQAYGEDMKRAFASLLGRPAETKTYPNSGETINWNEQKADPRMAAQLLMNNPDTAETGQELALKQYSDKNAMDMAQLKLENDNKITPYQQAQLDMEQKKLDAQNLFNGASPVQEVAGPQAPGMAKAAPVLTGEDYLKSLPPTIGHQVKALAEGRMQFPSGFALKSPYWQQMLQAVSTYDPAFDAVNYNARAKMRTDATSGKIGQTSNALNTAVGHLGQLQSHIDGLNNSNFTPYNWAKNLISTVTGKSNVTNFDTVKKNVVDEISKVWIATGGTEFDRKERMKVLDAANSPEQLNGAVAELGLMLKSKLDAINDQYSSGMGIAAKDKSFITPESVEILKKIGVDVSTPPKKPISEMTLEELQAYRQQLTGGK